MVGLAGLEREVNPTTTPDKVAFIIDNLSSISRPTALLSFTTLFILVTIRYLKRHFAATHGWVRIIPEIFVVVVFSTFLSSVYRWDKQGIAILGDVALSKDDSYFDFPLRQENLKWFKVTTPTAMYASPLFCILPLTLVQPDIRNWIFRLHCCSEAEQWPLWLFDQPESRTRRSWNCEHGGILYTGHRPRFRSHHQVCSSSEGAYSFSTLSDPNSMPNWGVDHRCHL